MESAEEDSDGEGKAEDMPPHDGDTEIKRKVTMAP
jgi:hypothetical protein